MRCGFCKQLGVDLGHVRAHVRVRPASADRPLTQRIIAVRDQVPDGRYAIDGTDATSFYRVRRHAGRVYVDLQVSDDFHRLGLPQTVSVLERIAQDANAALLRYGREIGVCGRCGRILTDETSRAQGIGPICARKGLMVGAG
jgi:hypothetical protein